MLGESRWQFPESFSVDYNREDQLDSGFEGTQQV